MDHSALLERGLEFALVGGMFGGGENASSVLVERQTTQTAGNLAFEMKVGSFDGIVFLMVIMEAFPLASVVAWKRRILIIGSGW